MSADNFILRYPELVANMRREDFSACFGCRKMSFITATGLSVHCDGSSNLACWELIMIEVTRSIVEG